VASVLYQVHRSRPHRWVQTWLPVLEQALGYAVVLPERRIDQVESFFTRFPQVKDLWLDGTERPIRRPRTQVDKSATIVVKKRHTHNNLLLTDAGRRVLALSPTQPGAPVSGSESGSSMPSAASNAWPPSPNPYRNHTPHMEDQLMLVACGLWNFHLKCTN
jgi:hypothetical protein